ncbi:MAG: ribokinase [Pseudomonadota bacterium]
MITVFGSVNLDIVVRADRLPGPGETVLGDSHFMVPGGKGANQAVAAARAVGPGDGGVRMVGAVGGDAFAAPALEGLKSSGVNIAAVATVPDQATGIALITVDAKGENCIAVSSGANTSVTPPRFADDTRALVTQNEVPAAANAVAWHAAKARGLHVIHNAAPASDVTIEGLASVDTLIVNATEFATIAKAFGTSPEAAEQSIGALAQVASKTVIVTLGGDGAIAATCDGDTVQCAAPNIEVVDTTGAGDAFVGAYAVAICDGMPFELALRFAVTGASLACLGEGAQASSPKRADMDAALAT